LQQNPPDSRHRQPNGLRPKSADIVAKVESCISPIFGETLKREAIDDSSNLSRIAEVACEFSVRR
jgi:hypothetical protein